ncbi:hypothetical protein [Streptomyces sp. bgisy027]|uniref:hypothetical protein n=1 Tax=unclassified Streptomyces TaxID=2593676 RepID=UPI003D76250E
MTESFVLSEHEPGARLVYEGELGTDLWRAGARRGEGAVRREATVTGSLATVKEEAERRVRH